MTEMVCLWFLLTAFASIFNEKIEKFPFHLGKGQNNTKTDDEKVLVINETGLPHQHKLQSIDS